MFWHSGVSGAPCSGPQDLVWSNDGWPRTPGKTARFHWPLRFGYFASGVWAPAVDTSKTANAKAPSKLRQCMIVISVITIRDRSLRRLEAVGAPALRHRSRRQRSDEGARRAG